MQTLKEYLFASGILEYGTPEEIEEAKKSVSQSLSAREKNVPFA